MATHKIEINKRSNYLQKYKTMLEEEFTIVGFNEEDGMILFVCQTFEENPAERHEFNVRPRGTFE
jgi:hypothetical protein